MSRVVIEAPTHDVRTLGLPSVEGEGPLHDAVAALADLLVPSSSKAGTLVVAHEVPLGSGQPDVTIASVDLDRWLRRAAGGVGPVSAPLALEVALTIASHGQISRAGLAASLPRRSKASVDRAVRTLRGAGWLTEAPSMLELRDEASAAVISVGAVEAKLGGWRRASQQATAWSSAVDLAWLAFPTKYLKNVPRRDPYLARLGLIAVSEAGVAKQIRKPRERRPNALRRRQTEEYLYSAWVRQRAASQVDAEFGPELLDRVQPAANGARPASTVQHDRVVDQGEPLHALLKVAMHLPKVGLKVVADPLLELSKRGEQLHRALRAVINHRR